MPVEVEMRGIWNDRCPVWLKGSNIWGVSGELIDTEWYTGMQL